MRKLHKKQLLELTETLDTACCQLKKQKENIFFNLCGEIQEFVSGMYEYVENIFGEDIVLAKYLKDIYEMLYHVSQGVISVDKVLKKVRKIESFIKNLKPDKMEVVFFCYKASMSDSLESIYFAAKEDENCDAYFVPIPYYERNNDGNFGKMYLEGEGYYSKQYELTDWQTYDVEARRPDVIFIMNPYDGQNRVTSVHPYFYSSRLKNYTDMLVYVGYGLNYWLYRDPFAPEAVEDCRKNCYVVPVNIHAHYCITYSEELAKSYLPTILSQTKIAQEWNMTEQRIKEKFIPLGSPKFDKILNYGREDYQLPKEWEKKIEGKKVVLYNTGLSEFLKSTAQQFKEEGNCLKECFYFEKVKSIISAFESRKDVILWWRPHPLFESTVRSMRPALYEEYQKMIYEFKERDKGILDETEEVHRAIAWSDGMISDESSLLLLYTATGKPFYIPSIVDKLPTPIYDDGKDFTTPLEARLLNMHSGKGANVGEWNICIWWHNFLEEDVIRNKKFECYEERFIDFVVHWDKYSRAEEYKKLQLQMIQDFVVNADGTAGEKIYEFVKQKTIG